MTVLIFEYLSDYSIPKYKLKLAYSCCEYQWESDYYLPSISSCRSRTSCLRSRLSAARSEYRPSNSSSLWRSSAISFSSAARDARSLSGNCNRSRSRSYSKSFPQSEHLTSRDLIWLKNFNMLRRIISTRLKIGRWFESHPGITA